MLEIKRLTVPAYGFAKNLDPERRQLLAICGQFFTFEEGEVIVNEGDTHTDLYFVLEGTLMLRRRINEHSYAPIGTAKRGSTFGELNLFHPLPARTTILAVTSGEIWRLSKEQFEAMIADDLVIAREALGYLCTTLALRLRRATERYANTKEEYDQLFDDLVEERSLDEVLPGVEPPPEQPAAE
ncbi:MAG TPA: cyclic nucleotide-binding domain-containing protein [Prosthecobacter sp.]|nr:cyclic nucleotide-binding domain-containing protein [Prosthecobacter sp.]HRK15921.1 cyclic nucleotide-binding domain-containing protein [Prosthecobacter sp.]